MKPPAPVDPRPEESHSSPAPTHSEDGVDLTLIRWMLSPSCEERLRVLRGNIRSL